jgi:hypothetical protein
VLAWNSSDYLELYFAAARGGYVLCPLNARLAPPESRRSSPGRVARFVLGERGQGLEALGRDPVPPVARSPTTAGAALLTSGDGKP